ncbi:ABC transporter substrate-binding protein [Corynebacterium hylobatis]|uniref:ABC transporter substrate-binding protein n=1 Tax=Corynebacterium hylobatis TaxID=1859290 RepID=A0A3S0BIQ0_9CORY|nr:ABC transporter substrate-binding protein [Corynebacterium hylobatis]RSZ64472.1 ABC transporter substrate-binding protein [Corynebacterium hylobatis]
MKPTMRLAGLLLAAVPLLSACGIVSSMPADVDGTMDRARDGTLVVGVSEHPPWVNIDGDTGEVTGSEAELLNSFARSINAEIEWRPGPESVLAERIRDGEVDVIAGGLTTAVPLSSHMALTRPYTAIDGDEEMVMGVRLGENELLVALERHLAREHGEIQ